MTAAHISTFSVLPANWARQQAAKANSFLRNLPYNWFASQMGESGSGASIVQSALDQKALGEFEREIWLSIVSELERVK
jgi:hypothetical protein